MLLGTAFYSLPPQSNNHLIQMSTIFAAAATPQHTFPTFKPFLPSPLRTSRNANVMSNLFSKKLQASENSIENQLESSRCAAPQDSTVQPQPVFFLNSMSNEVQNADADAASRAARFQYESRARSSSPSVQLQSHVAATRNSRKKVFLERLRHKRDDARFERNGEQVLHMDWLNERKAWEKEMSEQVVEHEDLIMEDEDVLDEPREQVHDEAMSPTEEKELEELVSYLERDVVDEDFDDAGEDYDALFLEVLDGHGEQQNPSGVSNTTDVEMT